MLQGKVCFDIFLLFMTFKLLYQLLLCENLALQVHLQPLRPGRMPELVRVVSDLRGDHVFG